MISKRLKITVLAGVALGIFCIIGALIRSGFEKEVIFLFALWYNRVIMGILIGLAKSLGNLKRALFRGAFLGLLVSFAFYASTGFFDHVSFIAGILYGVLIEYFAYKYN